MAKRYPTHIKATGNTLRYQRAATRRLLHIASKQLWTYPLGLSISASDSAIALFYCSMSGDQISMLMSSI